MFIYRMTIINHNLFIPTAVNPVTLCHNPGLAYLAWKHLNLTAELFSVHNAQQQSQMQKPRRGS